MPEDDSTAEPLQTSVPTYDPRTDTPTCGSTEIWDGRRCSFPVEQVTDRCYVHDEDAPWPADDPAVFLSRAENEPPNEFQAVVEAAAPSRGGLLAERYVYYSRQLESATLAAQLAVAVTREADCLETILKEGVMREGDTRSGTRPHPMLQQFLRERRQVRTLRKEAGLTAHADATSPTVDLDSLLTEGRE